MTRIVRHVPSGFAAKASPNGGGHLPKDPMGGLGERSRENAREMIVPERPRDEDRVINDARPDLGVRKLLAPHGDKIAAPVTGVRYGGTPRGGPVGRHPNPTPQRIDDVLEGFIANPPGDTIPGKKDGIATGANRGTEMIAIIIPVLEATARPTEERNIGFVLNSNADHYKKGRSGIVKISVEVTPSQTQAATLDMVKTEEEPK